MSMNAFCISMLLYCALFAHAFRNPCLPLASLSILLVLSELELEYAPTWIWPTCFDPNEHLARIWCFQYVSSLFTVYFKFISSILPVYFHPSIVLWFSWNWCQWVTVPSQMWLVVCSCVFNLFFAFASDSMWEVNLCSLLVWRAYGDVLYAFLLWVWLHISIEYLFHIFYFIFHL